MAIELLDLVYTLAAGVVLVSCIEIALWASLGHTAFQWLNLRDRFENPGRMALVVILVFVFGVFAEDLSKALVGKSPLMQSAFAKRIVRNVPLMPSEQDLRTGRLFELVHEGNSTTYRPKLLALEYARNEAFMAFEHAGSPAVTTGSDEPASKGREIDTRVKAWARQQTSSQSGGTTESELKRLDRALVDGVAPSVYYTAKNLAYMQPTLFEELTRIERRVVFGRSAAIAAIFGAIVLVGGLLASGVIWLLRKVLPKRFEKFLDWSRRKLWRQAADAKPRDADEWKVSPVWGRCVLLVFALSMLYVVGAVLYESESVAYNDRVFGYGLTLFVKEEAAVSSP